MPHLEVEHWRFWSPESSDPSHWLKHWRNAAAVVGEAPPPVDRVPAMQRRRMSRLTRMALGTALPVLAENTVDYSIFCSQHGEIARTREILGAISAGIEISPAAFAQSVHNTSSGLFTIVTESNAPSMSMAAGANTFAYAWLEAQAYLLAQPTHRVLLVDFDEALPEVFRDYSTDRICDHSSALLLRAAERGGISLSRAEAAENQHLPQGPQFLAWLQSGASDLTLASDGQGWRWAR